MAAFASLVMLSTAVMVPVSANAQDAPRVISAESRTGPRVADGLELSTFARRLGAISDMAMDVDGTIFAADPRSGRIWVVADRAMDGRADSVQPLPHRFDLPSGLVISNDALFVADRSGLWRLSGAGTPELLAPFAKAGATDTPHPIALAVDGSLRLGLSLPDGTARLLRVDTRSGEATLMGETRGEITGFTKAEPATPPLLLVGRDGESLIGATLDGLQPLPFATNAAWADAGCGVIALSGEAGVSEYAATLVGVGEDGRALVSGRASGPVLRDARGLFIAHPETGRIDLLRPALPRIETPVEADAVVPKPRLDPEALILRGSGLDAPKPLSATPRDDQSDTDSE